MCTSIFVPENALQQSQGCHQSCRVNWYLQNGSFQIYWCSTKSHCSVTMDKNGIWNNVSDNCGTLSRQLTIQELTKNAKNDKKRIAYWCKAHESTVYIGRATDQNIWHEMARSMAWKGNSAKENERNEIYDTGNVNAVHKTFAALQKSTKGAACKRTYTPLTRLLRTPTLHIVREFEKTFIAL